MIDSLKNSRMLKIFKMLPLLFNPNHLFSEIQFLRSEMFFSKVLCQPIITQLYPDLEVTNPAD